MSSKHARSLGSGADLTLSASRSLTRYLENASTQICASAPGFAQNEQGGSIDRQPEGDREPGRESDAPQPVAGIPEFWDQLGKAGQTVLLLDYDGTLAPFHVNRFRAFPSRGVIDTVERIAAQPATEVALISGRPVSEVRTLIVSESLTIVGTHGFELYRPGQGIQLWNLSATQVRALDEAETFANELVGPARTERKVATVAVHLRGLPETEAVRIANHFEKFCATMSGIGEMEVRRFDGGVELRAKGRDKGVAVRDLLAELPAADFVVYIGDDDTDEDAFCALPSQGIGIKVGPEERPTQAQGRLPSTEAVRQFLWSWISVRSPT